MPPRVTKKIEATMADSMTVSDWLMLLNTVPTNERDTARVKLVRLHQSDGRGQRDFNTVDISISLRSEVAS